MQPGDLVMIVQFDAAKLREGEDPTPGVPHWIYATVLEPLQNDVGEVTAARIEVNHPGNKDHARQMLVPRKDIRTAADIQALHDAHPAKAMPTAALNFIHPAHRELNNLRVALDRMKPKEAAA